MNIPESNIDQPKPTLLELIGVLTDPKYRAAAVSMLEVVATEAEIVDHGYLFDKESLVISDQVRGENDLPEQGAALIDIRAMILSILRNGDKESSFFFQDLLKMLNSGDPISSKALLAKYRKYLS
jgi:hypothetical protein